MNRTLWYLAGLGLALASPLAAQDADLTLERIFASSELSPTLADLTWIDEAYYAVVEQNGDRTDLYRVEAASGRRELVVGGADLVPVGGATPVTIDEFTFSRDRSKILLRTNTIRGWRRSAMGTFYVWDVRSRTLTPVSASDGPQLAAKFSPDGRYVGFVRDHDLFVRDLTSGEERRLTSDGSEDVINGTTDWVYEEELSLWDAFRFSPDGGRIAFWRLDQSAIRPFYLLDETALYPALTPVRYPKAGTANSDVRIGVVEIATGAVTWIDLGAERDIYVAAMDFADSAEEVWLTRLNRHQNRLDLLLANVRTGVSQVIMTDADPAWVDAEEPIWLDGGRQFVYPSERDGYRQLFLFRRDGRLIRKITQGQWDVTDVFGVDERGSVVYFTGAGDGALVRPVYRVGLNGGRLTRVSAEGGTHRAQFNPTYTLYVNTYSTAARPPVQVLRSADGRRVRDITPSGTAHANVEALGLVPPEYLRIPVADGVELNAYLIKPPGFDPSRQYPLLLYVYGGPGSQTVTNAWGGSRSLWHQLLAREGIVIASVDNRGTGARGRDFKKLTYLRLGQIEAADQVAAARYLGSLPFVDARRMAIWGWSYGGYMSLMSLFTGGDVFAAAVSVAPVTDWRLYDTIYTERYMRTPQENAAGYRQGAPLAYVDQLQGDLLVIHGTGDDNVHSQNTTQLVQKLEEAGKQFDMRLYPNKAHGISGGTARVNVFGYITGWLKNKLVPYAVRGTW